MDSGCSYLLTVCDFPYVPGPVLGPRDTSMNKADIPVVMVVCFLPPSLFSFIPHNYRETATWHALEGLLGMYRNYCPSAQGSAGK